MAIRDEVKEQQNKLQGKTFKEKLAYFWDYYKIHTFVVLLIILIVGIFIKDAITAKDSAFSATLLNAYGTDTQEDFQKDFAAYAGIDLNIYDCFIDLASTLSYETMSQMDLAVSQRILAMAQTGEIDVMVSDEAPFANYSKALMFKDLREELSAEEYTKFEPYFYYIDKALLDVDDEENESIYDENGNPVLVDALVDHRNPDVMEDPMPVGIYLDDNIRLKEWNCYNYENASPIFGFVYSSERPELCHQFLSYLTKEESN